MADMSLTALQREYQIVPSPANKQKLLDSINLAKHELGPECDNKDLDCDLTDRNMTYSVSLDEESITECFNEAMEMPLALAAARIRDAARVLKLDKPIGGRTSSIGFEAAAKPRVILAGGTANHEGLESRIKELCYINGLDSPVNTRGIITQYNSAKIASGAAFAAGSSLTVEKFISRGATFAIQMRQRIASSAPESEHAWDNIAYFLWSLRRPHETYTIPVTGRDDLKIVCDPFFDKEDGNQNIELYHDRCYDFVDLGRPTKGSWSFSLDLIGHGDQMKLIVHRSRQYGKAKPQVYKSVTVSLHYNRGSNSIHPGEEFRDANQDPNILSLRHYQECGHKDLDSWVTTPTRTQRFVARRGRGRRMPAIGPDRAARRGARRS